MRAVSDVCIFSPRRPSRPARGTQTGRALRVRLAVPTRERHWRMSMRVAWGACGDKDWNRAGRSVGGVRRTNGQNGVCEKDGEGRRTAVRVGLDAVAVLEAGGPRALVLGARLGALAHAVATLEAGAPLAYSTLNVGTTYEYVLIIE